MALLVSEPHLDGAQIDASLQMFRRECRQYSKDLRVAEQEKHNSKRKDGERPEGRRMQNVDVSARNAK